GSMKNANSFDAIATRGVFPPQKVVAGMLSNSANGGNGFVDIATAQSTIKTLLSEHPELGGVAPWEYFNSLPGGTAAPWQWAGTMATAMGR
ncbi:MAG: chitinase, partial [bacterium]|nr:chitinase [bacterium]